ALTLPVLFVLAERDQMTPPKAARKAMDAARAAGAEVTVVSIEGSGHNLMAEHPEETLAALRDWLPRVTASATGQPCRRHPVPRPKSLPQRSACAWPTCS